MPLFIQDYLDICDPVLTFDRFMGEIDLEKYLKEIPKHEVGRLRYNPVSMLKTILFGFMTNVDVSLRELEDSCKVNLRFMYLMDHKAPSYRRVEGADKILDYYRASKGAFLCIQKNKRILHYGYIIKQSL